MNNSSIHRSAKVQNNLKERNWYGLFLPPYAPELAPIELLFGILKKQIISRKTNVVINLKKWIGNKNVKKDCRIYRYDSHNENMGTFCLRIKEYSRVNPFHFWSS